MLLRHQTNLLEAREEVRVAQGSKTLLDRSLEFVRRQFWILLISLVAAMLGAAIFLLFVPPAYTAASTMMIDSRKGGVQQKSVLGDTPTDNIWIDSQMGVLGLQREQIGRAVAKQLQLGKSSKDLEPSEGWSSLFGLLGSTSTTKDSTQSEAELTQMAAGMVAGGLDVRRVGLSYLVNIGFTSPKPDLAVKIANAAADAYVIAEMDAKFKSLSQASSWLQDRYQTLKDQASAADRAVVEFKSKNNIVTAGGKLINDQQLTEINNRLGAAHAKTADAQARLNQIEAVLRDDQATPGGTEATVTDALSNPIISGLRKQYLDLINREADWSKRFGKNHLAVVNLRNQARDIRISTLEELKRIHETYKSDLEIAKQNESELEKQLASIVSQIPNEAQITLRGLESSAQSYRAFTDNFLLTYNESVQQQTSPIPETRVIAYATYAGKSFPSPGRVLTLSLLGGLAVGVGLGIFRELMDGVFRTGRQAQATLQAECIAMVPLVNLQARASFRKKLFSTGRGRDLITNPRSQILTHSSNLFRLVSDEPFSQFAEAIRAIKLAADVHGESHSAKVIGLTSSVPREGKSTIAAALAGQIAQVGCRVILVDCDLRNPALSRSLAPDASVGILEVISGRQSLDAAICKDPITGMAFLPTANAFGVPNTDQILASEAMKNLFSTLRSQYEYIIVDLSPLAPVVDVRATTELIDFYVFVVEWGATKIDMVQHTLQQAHRVYDNMLGVVLNKVNMNVMGRYDGERASYYSAKYYSGAQG
jgi:succinoglycan biosynthesis transport protein ExoP